MADIYEKLPKLKIYLTIPKFLVIIITISISFILPASLFNSQKFDSKPKSEVAGISTQRQDDSNIQSNPINFNDQSHLLIIVGIILIGLSILIIIYLFIDNIVIKKNSK